MTPLVIPPFITRSHSSLRAAAFMRPSLVLVSSDAEADECSADFRRHDERRGHRARQSGARRKPAAGPSRPRNGAPAPPAAEIALTAAGSRGHLPVMPVHCTIGLVALLAAVALLAGCKSAGASPPVPRATSSLKYGHGDGQTIATAVEIRS